MQMNWIWTPSWQFSDNEAAQFVYFRKKITLSGICKASDIKISADSRYKVYVNNQFIQVGPAKGSRDNWYYDQLAIKAYLIQGENVITVIVLRYPEATQRRNASLHRSAYPCLFIEGSLTLENGDVLDLSGHTGWKCYHDKNLRIVQKEVPPAPLNHLEEVVAQQKLQGWHLAHYRDDWWEDAQPYGLMTYIKAYAEPPFAMEERPIPYQRCQQGYFKKALYVRENTVSEATNEPVLEAWQHMIDGKQPITVPPYSKICVELDAGELMTGYLKLQLSEGAKAQITLKCAESYASAIKDSKNGVPIKGDRLDYHNGELFSYEDTYECAGSGGIEEPETYEPFWFRTFRFVGVVIETQAAPLVLHHIAYRETGYPLEIQTQVETSDPSLAGVWSISERTLRRCMHETYMDCPFFEQLQYAMDSRSQILFTYMTAADDRLARQCMEDLRKSQRTDGLLNSCAPACTTNVIPGFSIYYILMVYDHMMYFGDQELIKQHMPTIFGILHYFEKHLNDQGMIGTIGGPLIRARNWSFIDWVKEWNTGVPTASSQGPITMESLLYLYGLMHVEKLLNAIDERESANKYRQKAEHIRQAIKAHCIGTNGLLMDGPGVEAYSVHCQVFAILTDLVAPVEGKRLLTSTLNQTGVAQCSVAMSFYLFRALEKVGWYEQTDHLWELWRDMLRNNMTTCVENDTDARSDCHAWSAVALYELPAVTLGVQPAAAGYEKIAIKPVPGYLQYAKGQVITPKGMVYVEWSKDDAGQMTLHYQAPEGIQVML